MAAQPYRKLFIAFLLGFVSLLAQVVLIRTLLSVFSGNELIIGLVLGLWILFVAMGSMLSKLLVQDPRHLSVLFVLSGCLLQLINSTAWYVYPVAGLSFGEVIPIPVTLLFLIVLMMPLCLLFGAAFPMIVRLFSISAPVVYGLESLGAFFAGSLFSFFMAGYISDRVTSLCVSFLSVVAAVVLLKKKWTCLFFTLPFVLYLFLPHSLEQVVKESILYRVQSPEGLIIATETSGQKNIYISGKLSFSIPEPQTEELLSHIPALFTVPDDVLIIGGSPMLIKEFLKYGSNITYIQLNKKLLSLSMNLLFTADRERLTDNPSIHIITRDARAYLRETKKRFNLIVLNEPFPANAGLNRYYTMEFFRVLRLHLKKEGLFFLKLQAVPGYMSDEMLMANSSIFMTLKRVFPYLKVSSMEYAIVLASNHPLDVNPESLAHRFSEQRLDTLYLDSSILEDMFSPEKSWMFQQLLEKGNDINTDIHPVSYLYNILLWTQASGGRWLALIVNNSEALLIVLSVMALLLISYMTIVKGSPAYSVLFVTGFTTISLVTVSVFLYQSIAGYIYRMIGLMGAVYMFGSAAGALTVERTGQRKGVLSSLIVSFIILALVYPFLSPLASILFIVVFVSGLLGGGLFSICAYMIKSASIAYSLDLTGALFGAFIISVFLFPLFGLYYTTGFLVYLNILSLIALWIYQKKGA